MSNQRNHKHIKILFLLLCAIPFYWLRGHPAGWSDTGIMAFFYNSEFLFNDIYRYSWTSLFLTGSSYGQSISLLPVAGFFGILTYFGLNSYFQQAFIYFLILSTSMIFIYLFIYELFDYRIDKKLIALISAIFYTFNPLTMINYWYMGMFSIYLIPFIPVILYFSLLLMKKQKMIHLLLMSFFYSIFSIVFFNPAFVIPVISIQTLLFTYQIVLNWRNKSKVKKIVVYIIGLIIISLLINGWFILPFLFSITDYYTTATISMDPLKTIIGISKSVSLNSFFQLLPLNLDTPIWLYKNPSWRYWYNTPLFIFVGIFAFALIITPLILKKKDKNVLFFTFILLFGIFLCLGFNPPFGYFFEYMFKNIPFFEIFRQAYNKFMPFLLVSYSVLFGVGVSHVYSVVKSKSNDKFAKFVLILIIFLISGMYTFPMWTGGVVNTPITIRGNDISSFVEIPLYYEDISRYFHRDSSDYRIFSLPLRPMTKVGFDWEYGFDGPDRTWQLYKHNTISYLDGGSHPNSKLLSKLSENLNSNLYKITPLFGIKYIVIQNDVDRVHGNYGGKTLTSQQELKSILNILNVSFVRSFGLLDLYEVPDEYFIPHIYPISKSILINGSIEDMAQIVSLGGINFENNIFLIYNQTDDDQWQFLQKNPYVKIINKEMNNIAVNNISQSFNWSNLSNKSIEVRSYVGWKSVIRADGNESEDTLSLFSTKAIPYKFPLNSSTSWSAHDSTLIYLITDKKIAITDIKECKEKEEYSANIVGKINKNNVEVLSERRINISELKENEPIGVYLPGRKPIISMNSNESYGFYFPDTTDIPYSTLSWSSLNSTILYYKTENNPVVITGIKDETGNISKDIVGVWWKKGWLGMNSEKVEYPIVLPPYETIIIQINHKTDELEISYRYISPEDLIISTKSICNDIDDIVGIRWETDWMGKGTKPIKLPAVIPANQRAIIQINHMIKDKINFEAIDLIDSERLAESKISSPQLTFKKINPTRYNVRIENATEPFFLVFSESFHPQWKAYTDDEGTNTDFTDIIAEYKRIRVKEACHEMSFTPKDVFYLLKEPLSEDIHFTANGYANSWYVDPAEIDKDGDGNFTLTLFFKPQSYFYIGLAISLTTFMLCILYLIFNWRKNRNRRKEEPEDAPLKIPELTQIKDNDASIRKAVVEHIRKANSKLGGAISGISGQLRGKIKKKPDKNKSIR